MSRRIYFSRGEYPRVKAMLLRGVIPACLLLAACSSSDAGTTLATALARSGPPAATNEPVEAATVTGEDCSAHDRLRCLESEGCTLVLAQPGTEIAYVCRPAEGSCETGLAQIDLLEGEEACTSRSGCQYVEPHCFCLCGGVGGAVVPDQGLPDCDCECWDGPPPMCRP